MSKPVCTISNLQFCWNLQVDSYDNSVGDPDYFCKHYFDLGYRVRIIKNVNDMSGRPNKEVKSEDFNPYEMDIYDCMRGENVLDPYVEPVIMPDLIIPEPFNDMPMTPSESYQRKKKVVPQILYHRWKNVKSRDNNKQYCTVCGLQRHNIRVKLGSKTMKYVYIDKDDNDLSEMPPCKLPDHE